VKECEHCRRLPCACSRVELPECGICHVRTGRYQLEWVGMPNPFGAWRGEVFSHWKCKDQGACLARASVRASA